MVKNPPAMRETWVQSLSWEDPPEKGKATHSCILAWRIPMDRGAWRATVHGVIKTRTQLSDFHTKFRLQPQNVQMLLSNMWDDSLGC